MSGLLTEVDVIRRTLGEDLRAARLQLVRELYATAHDLDPEAFPDPLPKVDVPWKRAWRVGTVRFRNESEARAVAEKYDAKCRAVRVRRVPRGAQIVREALATLERRLATVPAWDEKEARRRAAIDAWNKRMASPHLGLAAWLPKSSPVGGETFTIPIRFGSAAE